MDEKGNRWIMMQSSSRLRWRNNERAYRMISVLCLHYHRSPQPVHRKELQVVMLWFSLDFPSLTQTLPSRMKLDVDIRSMEWLNIQCVRQTNRCMSTDHSMRPILYKMQTNQLSSRWTEIIRLNDKVYFNQKRMKLSIPTDSLFSLLRTVADGRVLTAF